MSDRWRDPGSSEDSDEQNPSAADIFDPINQPYGTTPLDEEARDQLLVQHRSIQTMAELNALESMSITHGLLWARMAGFDTDELLNQNVLCEIHKHMFQEVWQWAGRIRSREMSIGIAPFQIREQWKAALDSAAYLIERRQSTPAEVILKLHHRTVQIHPFVNGNGRHARLMTEELAASIGLDDQAVTWGQHLSLDNNEIRRRYLAALRALDEDRSDIAPLVGFAFNPGVANEWRN